MAHTEIRYDTDYRWDELASGGVVARLTHFACEARLLHNKCWNSATGDRQLLDHEQGHFDIAEINARRIQKTFDRWIAADKLHGRGRDEAAAIADLDKQIHALMGKFFDREEADQVEYDRVTHHGDVFAEQAKQRARQRELLKETAPKAGGGPKSK